MKKWLNFLILILFIIILIPIVFAQVQKYTLKVTDEHPFFVMVSSSANENSKFVNIMQVGGEKASESENKDKNTNGVWKTARNLQVGDYFITDDGKTARITSIKEVNENVDVYNLEAEPFNDFIVNRNVVVHNSNSPLEPVKSPKEFIILESLTPEEIKMFEDGFRELSDITKETDSREALKKLRSNLQPNPEGITYIDMIFPDKSQIIGYYKWRNANVILTQDLVVTEGDLLIIIRAKTEPDVRSSAISEEFNRLFLTYDFAKKTGTAVCLVPESSDIVKGITDITIIVPRDIKFRNCKGQLFSLTEGNLDLIPLSTSNLEVTMKIREAFRILRDRYYILLLEEFNHRMQFHLRGNEPIFIYTSPVLEAFRRSSAQSISTESISEIAILDWLVMNKREKILDPSFLYAQDYEHLCFRMPYIKFYREVLVPLGFPELPEEIFIPPK